MAVHLFILKEFTNLHDYYIFQLTFASSEAPGMIETAVVDAEKMASRVIEFSDDCQLMITDIEEYSNDVSDVVSELNELTANVVQLQHTADYLKCLAHVEDLRLVLSDMLCIIKLCHIDH